MNHPLITMTAITGKPSKSEIYEYLRSMKENGILSVLLYPRSGCEIEYLSEEWFSCIGFFIECAKELEMQIWLYDDFNWPSGDAGGKVTEIPEYRLKAICTEGENIGKISCKSRHNAGLFGEKYFPDLLSYDAVDYFIKSTHEEYYKRFSKDFGSTIRGIFTDEPSIGYCCQDGCIPYYEQIKNDYFEYCGRNFDSDMYGRYENFYLNATKIISNRFNECYFKKLSVWCENHGILMAGHLMNDFHPLYAVKHEGDFLKNLSCFSLPGIDEIETDFKNECEMSLLGSIEYASNKNGAMAELFALGPVDMSYAKKRAMIYLCSAFKINHYFLAISHFDIRGNMIVKDFFSNFSSDQPDFSGMKLLGDEAKKAAELAKKDFTPDVYVRYPFELSAKNIASHCDMSKLFDTVNKLTYSQIQWKYINDEDIDAPVIELNSECEVTLNGHSFDISEISRNAIVTDENGDTPLGIFVRRFNDGEFIAINLFADEKKYFINGNKVLLKKYDVYFSNDNSKRKTISDTLSRFSVNYGNKNVIRAMFLNESACNTVYCDFDTDIELAVRNDTSGKLNGEAILCNKKSDTLPRGMRNFYNYSDKYTLKQYYNEICGQKDFKYMPSIFLIGDFAYEIKSGDECALRLRKRKKEYKCGERILDFGKIEFSANTYIPAMCNAIEICGTDLLTEVYIDGALIDKKAFSPYVYDLKCNFQDKSVKIKIVQYSSIAPIFGDVDYWDKNVKECGWRGTPSPSNSGFGFDKIKFLM
ncbi:MAG: hypothetical protein II984_04790 [Clostridia bacterium]|nr:hypothetical protein [Clostridia bacterium]